MRSALHQQIRRTLSRHELCPPGSRVLVGLSGGSDSVALLLLLTELAEAGGLSVAGAAHFNHRARPTAGRDEAFCRALAGRLGVPFVCDEAPVAELAAAAGESFEAHARQTRYAFLARAAADLHADRIAVGHTLDDQAETFLLKVARGAGATGLGGIYPRRDVVIRPLLDTSRAALRAWLEARGEDWVDDETNADLRNPRNRIRHRVLDELDAAYGGPTRPQLARAAELLREDGAYLDELAASRMVSLARREGTDLAFDARALASEPSPLRRRLLLQAMRTGAAAREITLEHVAMAHEVLTGDRRAADVPGGRWELIGGSLVLFHQGERPK